MKNRQRPAAPAAPPETLRFTSDEIEQRAQNALGFSRLRLAGELQRLAEQDSLDLTKIRTAVEALALNGQALLGSIQVRGIIAQQPAPEAAKAPPELVKSDEATPA